MAKQRGATSTTDRTERTTPSRSDKQTSARKPAARKAASRKAVRKSVADEREPTSPDQRPGAPASDAALGSRREGARARMYHDLIFESAECVFGDKGFEHATMQDVASEAGISLKTLYAHFTGKQDLYTEIQRVRGASFVDHVLASTNQGDDPLTRLEAWARAYVNFLFAHADWLRIHLQIRTSWGLRPTEGYAAQYWQQGLDGVADILSSGIRESLFHAGDADRVAGIVLAIMQVQVAQAVEARETDTEAIAAGIMVQLERLLRA